MMKFPGSLTITALGLVQTCINEQENLENMYSDRLLLWSAWHCDHSMGKRVFSSGGTPFRVLLVRSTRLFPPLESAYDPDLARVPVTL